MLAVAWLGSTDAAVGAEPACGQVVTENMQLDRDLLGCPADGIVVAADDITIDLGGHTLTAAEQGSLSDSSGVRIEGHHRVTVENGSIHGFAFGVRLVRSHSNVLRSLSILGSPIAGISLELSNENAVERSSLAGPGPAVGGSIGVSIRGGAGNFVASSEIHSSAFGMLLGSTNYVPASENVVDGSYVHGNDKGIRLVHMSIGNSFLRNTIEDNLRTGLRVMSYSDRNLIQGNSISYNGMVGLAIAPDSDPNRFNRATANQLIGNRQDGLWVNQRSLGSVVARNVALRNGDDGIDVENPATTVRANALLDNSDLGVEAIPGTRDGGGNIAARNGSPIGCTIVICR